jgi:hypothetical protein
MDSTSPWTTLWGRLPTKAVNGGSSAQQKERNILKKKIEWIRNLFWTKNTFKKKIFRKRNTKIGLMGQ